MANEWYTQGRTSIDNPYVDEKSWYNYDNAPPTGVNYPNLGGPLYPETTQPRVPDWISSPNRPAIPERTGFNFDLSGITGPVMGGLQWLGDKFQRPDAKQKAYDAIMGDRKGLGLWDTQTGTYGGNEYDLTRTPSGLKVGSNILGFGEGYAKNFDSAFGSKSLEEMEQKKLDWAAERLRTGKGLSQRLRKILAARGITGERDRPTIDLTTITDKINVPAATTTGGGARHDYGRDRGGGYTLGGGFTGTRGQVGRAGSSAGEGRGHHSWRAQGGRIGYALGTPDPDEPTENIFEFIKDQNIPVGEQVEGEGDILGQLVAKYIEAGFPPDQAEEMAMQEFQQMAMGSEQAQGIASLR